MKYARYSAFVLTIIFILFSAANACEPKGEITGTAEFSLRKNQCHRFTLSQSVNDFFQITARQNGVDVELRLFKDDREISKTDSENLNSGIEFLPFIIRQPGNYTLEVGWVDDRQTMIKNEGRYTLEIERRAAAGDDESFVENFEKAKVFYDKATRERLNKKYTQAVADYLSAVEIYRTLSRLKAVKYKLSLTNYYLGVSYNLLKKYQEAVEVFETNRVSVTKSQDKYLENLFFRELGIAYFKTGKYLQSDDSLIAAVNGFERSFAENIGEKKAVADAYLNQAETLLKLEKIDAAVAVLDKIRVNFKENVTEYLLASLKIADIYIDLGNQRKAEDIISSLTITENLPGYVKGVFYKVSGKLYMKSNRERSLSFFGKASVFLDQDDDESAHLLLFTGNTHFYARDYSSARSFYERAKEDFERQNNSAELAQVLNNLSVIYYHQKEYTAAISTCENALNINIEARNAINQARNLINLMYFYEAAGNDLSAILYGKWAINTIQTVKYVHLQNLEKEVQDNFKNSFLDAFRRLADLLIRSDRIAEAEQVLRFIKEKEYQDYTRGEGEMSALDYTRDEESLLEKIKTGKKNGTQKKTPGSSDADESSPTKKLLTELKKQKIKAGEILFVSTLVSENSISLIATSEQRQKVYVRNIPRTALNKIVFEFREAVTDPEKNPKIAGKKLYDILIKPLEDEMLAPQTRKIVWSLDGVLRYISIPALFDGKRYVVQRFANIQLTLASEEKILLPNSTESPAIGFASSKPFENLSSLPIAKNELDCIFEDEKKLIINSTCKRGILKGKKVADEEFTREAFEDALGKYKLIHLTSHFVMQAGDNSKSYLLLGGGNDRKYTMKSFSGQQLNNTEILIMSACNTANYSSNGAEFESFATMAQKQGAKAVIGTLWSVADNSTANFMTEFYRLFKLEKLDKAESIRLAQINIAANKSYLHPFYWSPFVLFGNWR